MKMVSGKFNFFFDAVLTLPVILVALSVVISIYAVIAWRKSIWGLSGRVHYTLLAAAVLANSWFLYYWNLIGYRI
jgi:hypothetical protein